MGRRRFKAFIPPTPPPGFVKPANAESAAGFDFSWEKPIIVDTTVDVDKAKSRRSITSNYSIGPDDHFIGVDTAGGSITITLPPVNTIAEGKIYIIKDEGGSSATNAIEVRCADSARIDNLKAITLASNYCAINIYFNASDWHIF